MTKERKAFADWGSDALELANQTIADFEGFRAKAYLCPADVWTIGYGHTGGVKAGMVISQDEAEKILWTDVLRLKNAIAPLVNVEVTQGQFIALLSFTYNVGIGNLSKSTLLRELNKGNFVNAGNEFARWIYVNKQPLKGLMDRRAKEREIFDS